MAKMLDHVLNTPSADLLVLIGLVILAVAIVGGLNQRIHTGQGRRLLLSLVGCLFVALGFLVHSNQDLTASADESKSHADLNSSPVLLDPDSGTFSASAVDKYLGKPSDPPAYFGQIQVSVADFLGTWTNLGKVGQHGIHKLRIAADGSQLLVHAWGVCKPSDCDWGEQRTILNQDEASVAFDTGARVRRLTLRPMPSGELQVEVVGESPGNPATPSPALFARLQ
ncbi:MAG TPA: hypothetical protein VMX16_16100 [Terriglobia bacterium]|nr:hypothetical protein [Terriglobia bacterium]